MLEKMDAFFDSRLEGYDRHMMTEIEGAETFYPFTAGCLPMEAGANVLDLGCGTGLELEAYFGMNPSASVTGIDLAEGMLSRLKRKFKNKAITLIRGSYFETPFEENAFHAAVSVESLHHFSKEEKLPLYEKLAKALKPGGYFILTDYFAPTEELEASLRMELLRLKKLQNIDDNDLYHYDTPLTVRHEIEALTKAGFATVEVLQSWGNTYTLKASL